MSTPDNRSVNFLACFAGDSITQRRGRWKTPCPGLCRKSRYQDDALCDPFYAADRRIYSLLADCPGRSAWAGSCHCAVRLKFTHAGIVVAGQAFCNAITPAILNWFYEVRGKLQESGQVLAPVEGKPDYQALADTLKRAFKQLDKTFLDDL